MPPPASPATTHASFPVNLHLPEGDPKLFADAAEAVGQEYLSSVRWKRLRCRNVQPLTGEPGNTIFILDVGHSIEFDWTWEGAVAFRPKEVDNCTGDIDASDDFTGLSDGDGCHGVWSGEVVWVDEMSGRLFVSVSDLAHPPCRGTFFVRPFEFLAFLRFLFCGQESHDIDGLLPARLNAARGIHPPVADGPRSGLPEFAQMWGHSWAVLWGPPGCGKTTNVGRQVAACLGGDERILVVSTTNKATDAAALAIGKAALAGSPRPVEEGRVLRIGKGADYDDYQAAGLTGLLRGTEAELLRQVGSLTRDLEKAVQDEDKAVLRGRIQDLRRQMKDNAFSNFISPEVEVVIATAFKAVTLLTHPDIRSMAAAGQAPFTTVMIDEAGLMSRAVVAGLSLLASRRVVVVGDAKQLAPISKMSRVLPTSQVVWLASSCLTHLQQLKEEGRGVHLLREQHRMHPQISKAVSHYQYEGTLRDSPGVLARNTALPPLLAGQPRAVWYVLDEDGQDLPSIRAERGPGNKSWVRPATRKVLEKLFSDPEDRTLGNGRGFLRRLFKQFFSGPDIRKAKGLFITPFKAQARDIAGFFAAEKLGSWSAGTVHAQQGTEADVVIFDTVNAGSCAWPYDEWKRLVNVGISRAREFVLVLASRAEMSEPYLRPLRDFLAPRVLKRSRRGLSWEEVPAHLTFIPDPQVTANPDLLGSQIARRKALRPVMSAEQQRLCGYSMDGKPRLVRGVAGSGKTLVLAHWLQKTVNKLAGKTDARVWAVYANRTLHRLIQDTTEEAWKTEGGVGPSPLGRAQLHHVQGLLLDLLRDAKIHFVGDAFDYDGMAKCYLERVPFEKVQPGCQVMFIDEAQDMGPNTLKLLSALVEQTDPANPKSRAVNIFYDNAQDIYGRGTPRWNELGLDMRGRSTVMKESFRSTRPITEYALNVLYRLQPPNNDPDHQELIERELIEPTTRNGQPWWTVRFNQIDGPMPELRLCETMGSQIEALTDQLVRWIRDDGVKPGDICILYNGSNIPYHLEQVTRPALEAIGVRLVEMDGRGTERPEGAVIYSTSNSFKGYESEVVVIPSVEQFVAKEVGALPNKLFVAMTRARSILVLYGYARKKLKGGKLRRKDDQAMATVLRTLRECLTTLVTRPQVECETSAIDDEIDDFEELLERVGPDFRDWLRKLWKSKRIQQVPIVAGDGKILAEPLFWFKEEDRLVACFGGEDPGTHTLHTLEVRGIEVIRSGQIPSGEALTFPPG